MSGLVSIARGISEWALGAAAALVPERCLACGCTLAPRTEISVATPQGWCAECASGVVPLGRSFCLDEPEGEARWRCRQERHLRLLAAVQYGGAVAELVRATKFRDNPALLAVWVEAWVASREAAGGAREPCDLLVPIPAHPARVRERGFDVAAEWTERLARSEGVPHAPCLVRARATPPQVGLDRAKRAKNVAGAFAPSGFASALRDRRVALVDDVVTTGSTARAAAEAAREGGARAVTVWSLAYEPLE